MEGNICSLQSPDGREDDLHRVFVSRFFRSVGPSTTRPTAVVHRQSHRREVVEIRRVCHRFLRLMLLSNFPTTTTSESKFYPFVFDFV
ncbi:hypothetical protein RIF29_14088 [Crotalaria pallida]|uniref:Uncharacterized protein n=1 Tax=Crotalaria pallida TaxID=3830 RepID=A0AAN9FAP5_CROPI